MCLPFFKVWGQLGYEPLIFNCTILDYHDKNPMNFLLGTGCGVPMLIITFCYLSIFRKVKKTGQAVRNMMDVDVTDAVLNQQLKKREAQMTKTTVMVWLGYVICFLPTTLIMTINPMPPNRNLPGLHIAGYIIFWCSGFINPVIYIISNKYYRKAMQEVVCCINNEESSTNFQSRATSRSNSSASKASRRRRVSYDQNREEEVHLNI